MCRVILCSAAALLTFGIAATSVAAGDRETCQDAFSDDDARIVACDRLISRNPKDANAYHNRGAVYFFKDDGDRAISDLDQAIRLDPKSARTYWVRGEFYEGKHDYDRAVSDFDQVIRLDPGNPFAYNSRGRIYKLKGDYVRAISDFDQAIRLNPESSMAYCNRGDAYNRKGDHDRAISDFDQVIQLDSKFPVPRTILGLAYEGKNDLDHAIRDFDLALELDPNDADARRGRERAAAALASRDSTKPALDTAPAAPSAPVPQPRVDVKLPPTAVHGDTKPCQGIADCTQLIESGKLSGPALASAYFERSAALLPGNTDRRIADLSKAIEIDPRNFSALRARGSTYDMVREHDRAMKDLTEAIDIATHDHDPGAELWLSSLYIERREIYKKLGQYDLAIADTTKLIELDAHPERPEWQEWEKTAAGADMVKWLTDQARKDEARETGYRADLYLEIGRREEAIADYRRALRLDPSPDNAKYITALKSLDADP